MISERKRVEHPQILNIALLLRGRHDFLIFTFFRAAPKSVKVKFELPRGGEENKSKNSHKPKV